MEILKWVQQTAESGYNSIAGGLGIAGAGVGYVTEVVGNLRLFGSTSTSDAGQKFDERHYFLVPDKRSADGFSLVVTRCLPDGVPPINELPKRRLLHLHQTEAEAMLRTLLVRQAQAEELGKPSQAKSMGDRARELADYIDALDDRVFGGVLLIGGLVAIFNPLAGAAIAAKFLLPSIGMMASKYGLRVAEDSLNQAELQRKIKQAEKHVLSQFRGAQAKQYVNEVLTITERAMQANKNDFDPVVELQLLEQMELTAEKRRMLQLAGSAVLNVYDSATQSIRDAKKMGLGSDEFRFLEALKNFTHPNSNS